MNRLDETVLRLDDVLRAFGIKYVVLGGVSVIMHGIQRPTQDVDVSLLIEVEDLKPVAEKLLSRYLPRKKNPVDFFQQYFVLPVTDPQTHVDVDIAAGLGGFERGAIQRAVPMPVLNRSVPSCTVEDLIIYKLAANRGRDIDDVKLLKELYSESIDRRYLYGTARMFIELERGDILDKVERLFPHK